MRDLRRTGLAAFLFAALLLSSGAFAPLWTDTASHDVAEGGPILQFVWSAIYLCTVACLLPRYKQVFRLAVANWPLALLLILCFASALWSANPEVTLRKTVAITGTTLLGTLFALEFDIRAQLRILAAVIAIVALSSAIAELLLPSYFPATEFAGSAWHGVFSHKNLLGRTMAIGVAAFLCLGYERKLTWFAAVIGVFACVILIVSAHSQTALVIAAAILFLAGSCMLLRLEWRPLIALSLLALSLLTPALSFALSHREAAIAFLGRDATFTGRSAIWELATQSLAKHSWLGYGYGAFWWISPDSLQVIALLGYETPNAHNGFLDLGLQLGAIGLLCFILSWLSSAANALRLARSCSAPQSNWPFLFLCFLLLYSFTESSLLAPNSLLWILYASVCVSMSTIKVSAPSCEGFPR